MKKTMIEIRIVANPEKIRATDTIVVCVEVTTEKGTFPGIGLVSNESEEGLNKAVQNAVKNALIFDPGVVPTDLFLTCAELDATNIVKQLDPASDKYKEMSSTCTAIQQDALDEITQELGIGKLTVDGKYTLAAFYCMKRALEALITK